jgi:hypothetical protein
MRLKFLQTGGFAGLVRGCELDTRNMEPHEAERLRQLVRESGVQQVAGKQPAGSKPDARTYEFSFEEDEGPRGKAVLTDSDLTDKASALIQFLRPHCRPTKP